MKKKFVEGIVKRHPDGFGFLVPDQSDHPDVYIPRHSMEGVMSNDRILVEVEPERGGQRFRGELIRVVKRYFSEVMGKYHETPKGGLLVDEGHGWGSNLTIPQGQTAGAKEGDFVVVEISSYPDQRDGFRGRVTKVLGRYGDPLLDVRRVIILNKIPNEFSQGCIQDAKKLPKEVRPEDMQGRRDLTSLPLITIDGATAKDFDDAVFVENRPDGFRCVVAIADVSHYVRPGRPMDKDAYERGTSTYFPNYVVPMLPEELSNELCSLKPNVIRLAVVADMNLDFQGNLKASTFYEAFIKSQARVIYGEAQEVIDGNCPPKLEHVRENILRCSDLAKILLAKRNREGSLQLEIGETEIVLNEAGEPIDILRAERIFAHRLIEELMLMANVAVAKFFHQKQIDALYRIHESPRQESLNLLNKYLENFGSSTRVGGGSIQKKLTKALETFAGKPHEEILNILTLRSMNQAVYSPDNVGHFGLGFQHYTHFTSPIRRYPDLIVHRLLKSLILKSDQYRQMSLDELASAGTHLSGCEQRSTKCERQFHSIKKARFMSRHLGEEFDGVVSSVTKFGVFVLLREFDCDGLIKVDDLGDDRFEFDEDNLRLVGKRTGFAYEIGMSLRIQVANADIDGGRVDFVLPDHAERAKKGDERREGRRETVKEKRREDTSHGKTNRPHSKKRGAPEDNRRRSGKTRFRKRR